MATEGELKTEGGGAKVAPRISTSLARRFHNTRATCFNSNSQALRVSLKLSHPADPARALGYCLQGGLMVCFGCCSPTILSTGMM